jgi:hypothetical protein
VLAGAAALTVRAGPAGEKKAPEVTEKEFRRANFLLLEDPLDAKAKDHAKVIIAFANQTLRADVALGKRELQWLSDKQDKRGLLLLAAYVGGNTLSQLDSGVKRNDPYPGLLQLFCVYRVLQARDRDYHIAEADRLLKLHREGRLIKQLLQEDERKPEKKKP